MDPYETKLVNDTEDDIDRFFGATGNASPSEDMVKKLEGFVIRHADKVKDMEAALTETLSPHWDFNADAIRVNTRPFLNNDNIISLVKDKTNNELFNKVVGVFSFIAAEIRELEQIAEERFYGPLTMFAHISDEEDEETISKDPEVEMGRFLPFLQDLCNYVRRIRRVCTNTIHQLACLYHERQKLYLSTFKHIHLNYVFERLGSLLRILVTLDAIINENRAIGSNWQQYKKMLKYIRAEPERFGLDQEKLKTFESLMVELDRQVLSGRMFENCISQDFGLQSQTNARGLVAENRVLFEESSYQLREMAKKFESELQDNARPRCQERIHVVGLFALYALHRRLFLLSAKPDKKLFRQLWALQQHVPLILLTGRAVWYPANFLRNHAPLQVKSLKPNPTDVVQSRKDFLDKHDQAFNKRAQQLYIQVCAWMVRIDSELQTRLSGHERSVSSVVTERSGLLLKGMLLAMDIQNLLSVNIMLHFETEVLFKQSNVRSLAKLVEMLKTIQAMYHRKSVMIAENISNMINLAQFNLKRIFDPVMKRLENHPRLDDQKLDVLAAMGLTLDLLNTAPTSNRMIVLSLSLQIAQLKNTFKKNQADEVGYQMWSLSLLSNWEETITRICHLPYLYFAMDLFPAMLKDIYDNPDQVNRLGYLLTAFQDPTSMLKSVRHQDDSEEFYKWYVAEVERIFKEEISDPLSHSIETDLRLHIHSVVLKQESLRKKTVKPLSRFINLKPLPLFGKTHELKRTVEHYLDTTFYNMATVALHDWKIYAEMRNLAQEKYGLELTEVHLPSHSHYSEGLDVLEIMRHIHIFVARYSYNLNTQCFIERSFNQKHLNTINIEHIANSIRTHGTGIMNTTVNFAYQFLIQKFHIFSEFLYDDHIQSRLLKETRFFRDQRDELDNQFPYTRAEKFTRTIRKLGVTSTGLSYLDQFRRLITEIGNALGYIRMVRSGGLSHCSRAIKFVPDLDDIPSFETLATDSGLSEETVSASKNLDDVIGNLSENFAEGTDYYKLLVSEFSKELKKKDGGHLKYFAIIIPPLTISFIEKMIAQKDRLTKKGKAEASFTDDGFPLGLAFTLKVLGQNGDFDALHWWESTAHKLREMRQAIQKEQEGKKSRSDDFQTLQLRAKRCEILKTEWDLLFFSFRGARIFFRDSKVPTDAAKEGDEAAETNEAAAADANGEPAAAAPAPDGAAAAPPPAPAGAAAVPPPAPAVAAPPPLAPAAQPAAAPPPPAPAAAAPPPMAPRPPSPAMSVAPSEAPSTPLQIMPAAPAAAVPPMPPHQQQDWDTQSMAPSEHSDASSMPYMNGAPHGHPQYPGGPPMPPMHGGPGAPPMMSPGMPGMPPMMGPPGGPPMPPMMGPPGGPPMPPMMGGPPMPPPGAMGMPPPMAPMPPMGGPPMPPMGGPPMPPMGGPPMPPPGAYPPGMMAPQ